MSGKTCPRCGKFMMRWFTGVVYATYPAQQHTVWWCGCGHREDAGRQSVRTEDDRRRAAWERAQQEHEPG